MSSGIDKLASQLQKTINEKDKKKKTGYYSQSEVVKVTDDTVWVKIPGGIDETPVSKTVNASPGDIVQVRVEGGRAWIAGNYTAPATDDTTANHAYKKATIADEKAVEAIDNANIAQIAAEQAVADADRAYRAAQSAESSASAASASAQLAQEAANQALENIEQVEEDLEGISSRLVTAEGKIDSVENDIETLEGDVASAQSNISTLQGEISDIESDVSSVQDTISEIQNDISTAQSNITDLQEDVSSAQSDISTVQGNITTLQSDVSNAQSNITTIQGNITTLQSDVSNAQSNITTIQGDISSIESDVSTAQTTITTLQSDMSAAQSTISSLESDVSTAQSTITALEGDVATAQNDITTLQSDVTTAQSNISTIQGNITTLQSDVTTAQSNITTIQGNITTLQQNVSDAQDDIDDALEGLALAENVIGTLNWLTAHSTATTDTTPVSGKSYYIRNQDGTFVLVTDTAGKNPASEGWYEMDEAISNYVAAHLSLTDYGLNLTLDNTSYRIHIGTLTASGDDGVYIIDGEGHVVTFFGESIEFDEDLPFHIGNENNYILWNPTQNRIEIGGNVLMGSDKTLSEVLAEINGTFIFDTTYQMNGTIASFEAHLYKGGIDVKEYVDGNNDPLYPPAMFTWYLKHEDSQTQEGDYIGSGYRINVNLSTCNYGAEVIAHFTTTEDSPLLNGDDDNITDVNNHNLTGRTESGESVRVRDLTVSTNVYSTDKLMIVGSEDEHLVSVQTLQDYLNANLDKQVLFDTTAGWSAQTSLVSKTNTLYIYTDHQTDSQGNPIAGIKAGDGNAYVVDLPFTDAIATEHIADTTRHVTSSERMFWNNKVRCYYAGTENLVFTTS